MMNLYEVQQIEKNIERIAEQNSGEIPDELLKELVEAHTGSLVQVEKLCHYVRNLELFQDACKEEENRISRKREIAGNRIDGIKKYLLPYVQSQGKVQAGTFKISTRKSEYVEHEPDFDDARFIDIEQVVKVRKTDIKKALKNGDEVKGACLKTREHLSIK